MSTTQHAGADIDGGARVLPAPSDLPRGEVHTDFDGVELGATLEWYAARDRYPVPLTVDREGYHGDRHFDYWASGLRDYLEVVQTLRRHGAELREGDGVLEMGAASGRVLRHFLAQHDGLELWATDVNPRHVGWCQRWFEGRVKAVVVGDQAHFPIPDASMSLVCAYSVFTHLDAYETAWLAEIRRVLRPGGFAVLTISSERRWSNLGPGFPVYGALMRAKDHPEYGFDPAIFERPMPDGKVVFRMGRQEWACNVFHSDRHVREVWGGYLEPMAILDSPARAQASVYLRKRRAGAG